MSLTHNSTLRTQNSVFTLGQSTQPVPALVQLLQLHRVSLVADVRTIPRSGRNPQFNRDILPSSLAPFAIEYVHLKGLGGLRKVRPDSVNQGWENLSFRGYADYMQTEEFAQNLEALISLSRERTTAIMCAEALPWRCHRSLIADALWARGIQVEHIMTNGALRPHTLTSFAKVEGTKVMYPGKIEG
jgi:uncharacterized protein (DUF488 family)